MLAVDEAVAIAQRRGKVFGTTKYGKPPRVRVHTTDMKLADDLLLKHVSKTNQTLSGTPVEMSVSDGRTSLLSMLHELIFCCDTFIDGDSALSSLAALGTHAVATISSKPWNDELGFKYDKVVGEYCNQQNKTRRIMRAPAKGGKLSHQPNDMTNPQCAREPRTV